MAHHLPDRCDVCIVGAGLAGLSAAVHLARGGARPVVLEAEDHPGKGASGGQLGMACVGLTEHAHRLVSALGLEETREIYDFSRESLALLAEHVPVTHTGSVWVALDEREPSELDASAEVLTKMGIVVDRWSEEKVMDQLQTTHAGPALHFPHDLSFDPQLALSTLAREAEAHGATLIHRARVTGVDDHDDGALIVRVGARSLHTEVLINAAGAGAGAVHPALTGCIVPIREQAAEFTLPTDLSIPVRGQYGYLRWCRGPSGDLQIAGCRWATPHLEVGETDPTPGTAVQSKLEALAHRLYPHSMDAPIKRRWAWIEAGSCDGLPFVGLLPGNVRHIAACGFVGNDAALALRAGRAVAEGLLVGRAVGVPERFAPRRML